MKIENWFWLFWLIDLGYTLVIAWDMLRRWSERAMTPLGGSAWESGKWTIALGLALVIGGLVLRYGYQMPKAAAILVAAPVAAAIVFFLAMLVIMLFGGRMN